MSKINETNYPRRTQANYADTDMLVVQAAGGNTYTTRLEDMREDYEATLAPTLSALQNDINENLATIEGGSTASKVYAKGDYLVFGGKLCRVTSTSIAAGATLTIGTNIELAPVGDELKTLSSDLANKAKVQKLHLANTLTVAFTNSLAVVPWSTLNNLDRTKYSVGSMMCSCGASDGVLCASFRFDDAGITLWSSKPSYTGNIQLQVYAVLVAK
jgi:hypothetical protein